MTITKQAAITLISRILTRHGQLESRYREYEDQPWVQCDIGLMKRHVTHPTKALIVTAEADGRLMVRFVADFSNLI